MRVRGLHLLSICLCLTIAVALLGHLGWFSNRTYSLLLAASGYVWGLSAGLYLQFGAGDTDKRVANFLITSLVILAIYWGLIPDITWYSGGPIPDSLASWAIALITSGQSLAISLVLFNIYAGARKLVRKN